MGKLHLSKKKEVVEDHDRPYPETMMKSVEYTSPFELMGLELRKKST